MKLTDAFVQDWRFGSWVPTKGVPALLEDVLRYLRGPQHQDGLAYYEGFRDSLRRGYRRVYRPEISCGSLDQERHSTCS